MMKKNAIMARVRMPLTHQFFHLVRVQGGKTTRVRILKESKFHPPGPGPPSEIGRPCILSFPEPWSLSRRQQPRAGGNRAPSAQASSTTRVPAGAPRTAEHSAAGPRQVSDKNPRQANPRETQCPLLLCPPDETEPASWSTILPCTAPPRGKGTKQ